MMPFLYPPRPILIIGNQDPIDDDDDEEEDFEDDASSLSAAILSSIIPIPITDLASLTNPDEPIPNEHGNPFRVRLPVDGFQPNEINISIRNGQLIVCGKHMVRMQTQSLPTNSTPNDNDDIEPDFIAKEFKRTFPIPSNTDIRKAHAQFYPQQELLVIEIPLQNSTESLPTRINRIRPVDIFVAIVMILTMDQAVRLTYEQQLINPTTSQYRNRRRRENRDVFF